MDPKVIVAIAVVVVALIVVAVVVASRKRRSAHLREQFGPEYDRTVAESGNPNKAEALLAEREKRVQSFPIRTLSDADRQTYTAEWEGVQRHFVDDPSMAVTEADSLVNRVMTARGYPVGDFDQRAADISVSHPIVVQNFRSARDIAMRHSQGQANTEDLRQAMVHYRALFNELLDAPKPGAVTNERVYQRAS